MAGRALPRSLMRSLCTASTSLRVSLRRCGHLRTTATHRAISTSKAPVPPPAEYAGRLAEDEQIISPFRNLTEFYRYMLPEEDASRSLFVSRVPPFAISDDVRLLFEESGFKT
jgi:hypothetical protein